MGQIFGLVQGVGRGRDGLTLLTTGDGRRKTGDRRRETEDGRPETGDGRFQKSEPLKLCKPSKMINDQ